MNTKPWRGLVAAAVFVALSLVFAGTALAAPPVSVQSASALDSTHVRIFFNRAVDSSATNPIHYTISPSLAVMAVALTDGGRSATLTTAAQTNATSYTVTVSGIKNLNGSQQARFIGTSLGPNDATTFEDDFNRPSGLLLTDTPIAGPWTNLVLTGSNVLSLQSAPSVTPAVPWAGSGSLSSQDTPISADADNADVQAKIAGSDFFYSAYLYLPQQSWPADTEVGLLRINTSLNTAHARVYALAQSGSAYTLMVNWKNPTGAYNATGSTVATGVSFGQWHWIQMHVRNGDPGTGEIQVFLDGKLLFQDASTGVYPVKVIYAEAGIMHMSSGTTATTYTDQLRLADAYTLPSVVGDTTAPSGTSVTASAPQIHDPVTLTAAGSDAIGLQRAEFLLDGQVVASSDYAPDYHWTGSAFTGTYSASWLPTQGSGIPDGTHQLTARVYDTSGNVTTAGPVTVSTDTSGPALVSPAVSPNPFTPNGDGSQETTRITSSTLEPLATYTVQIFSGSTLLETLKSISDVAAGDQSTSWTGAYYDEASQTNVPVPDGTYTARITASDLYGRTTTADVPVTVDRTLKSFTRTPSGINPLSSSPTLNHVTGTYYLLADADVEVTVTDSNDVVVRTIQAADTAQTGDPDTPVAYSFTWDGRDDAGVVAPDGAYTLRVTAVNAIGTVSLARTVATDATAPTVSIDSLAPLTSASPYPTWTPARDGSLTVTFTVDEATSGTVKFIHTGVTQRTITITPPGPGQATVTWDGTRNDQTTAAAEGTYKVTITVADPVGNQTSVTSQTFVLVVPPVVAVVGPTGGESYAQGSAQTISWTLSGSVGTGSCQIEVSSPTYGDHVLGSVLADGRSGAYTLPWTVDEALGDDWKARITYLDAGGSVSAQAVSAAPFTIFDATPPATGDDAPAGWQTAAVTVQLSPSDSGSGMSGGAAATHYSTDGGATWSEGTSVAFTTDGVHTLDFYSTDAAGNDEAPQSRTVRIDSTAPATGDDNDGLPHRSMTLLLDPSDETSGVAATLYRIDGGSWQTGTSVTLKLAIRHKRAGLSAGDHLIEYYSTDLAGNTEVVESCTVTLE